MAKMDRPADTEALDRLEDKVRLLVALVGRVRGEQAQTADALQRATRELDEARARLKETDGVSAEIVALKDEREMIRTRVSSLLAQIEDLNL